MSCSRDAADVTIRVVGGKVRRLWAIAAIAVVVAASGALVWVVWRSPQRSDLATFWASAATVIVPVVSLVVYLARFRKAGDDRRGRPLDEVADSLALVVTEQWSRAALERRLRQPGPIPVQ